MHRDNILETQLRMKRDDDQARAPNTFTLTFKYFSFPYSSLADIATCSKKTILQPSHVRYFLLT
jgi:hypothetical protein